MRGFRRLALVALLLAVAPAISGCADFDMDKLDVFGLNQKKPLPGERHAVFPEGVPGVTQGIPRELMAGGQQEQPGAAIALDGIKPAGTQTAAAQPAEEKPKAKPKPKPKKVVQTSHPTRIKMAPQDEPASAAQPAAAPAAQPAAAQQGWTPPSQTNAPWPAPPPAGTFSKQQ